MAREAIDKRVESLELRVNELEQLPAGMTALERQILQLREEMHGEFFAVRTEMRALNEQTNVHMRALHEDLISRLARIEEGRSARGSRRTKP